MTKYSKGEWTNARYDICEIECDGEVYCTVATKDVELIIRVLNENEDLKQSLSQTLRELRYGVKKVQRLAKENEQLKQFPVKLDNRISKLEESLKALKEMETDDLNPQAVEDVATVIGMSLNALLEFRKELNGDDVE